VGQRRWQITTVYALHLTRVKPSNDARLSSLTVQYALAPGANPPYPSFYDDMNTLQLWPVRSVFPTLPEALSPQASVIESSSRRAPLVAGGTRP
jgi:hypothetical protein